MEKLRLDHVDDPKGDPAWVRRLNQAAKQMKDLFPGESALSKLARSYARDESLVVPVPRNHKAFIV